jgi:hypothetical protein
LSLKRRAGSAAAVVTTLVLVAVSAGTPGAVAQAPAPIDCPTAMPVEDVNRGMIGTGWTVAAETDPEPFSAEVLGVLQDGIAPGRDLIVADLSSPAISAVGGAWQGMSGSPVYVDDALIGAVSRSLSTGPSTIVGLTPAADMMDLLDYPDATSSSQAAPLGKRMAARISAASGEEASASDEFKRMRVPLSVSGLSRSSMKRLRRVLDREDAPYLAYAGASSAKPASVPVATLGAGDSFAAAFSYGDVTTATIGTTSLICGGEAVAFGHPLEWRGKTFMGANAARTLGIVDDEVDGPYKLAKVKGLAGTVDQDRLAGVRAQLDEAPDPIPIRVDATSPDTGRTQSGRSWALLDEVVPPISFFTLIGNMDSVFDQISGGSSTVSFRIEGLKKSGESFAIDRLNAYSTHEDISITSSHELERFLWTLVSQTFQDITLTKVTVDTVVREDRNDLRISNLLLAVNDGRFKDVSLVRAKGGDRIRLRLILTTETGAKETVETSLKVPRRAKRDGFLSVAPVASGSEGQLSCFFQGTICKVRLPGSVESFADVLEFLDGQPRNNVIRARMSFGRRFEVVKEVSVDRPLVGRGHFAEVKLSRGEG